MPVFASSPRRGCACNCDGVDAAADGQEYLLIAWSTARRRSGFFFAASAAAGDAAAADAVIAKWLQQGGRVADLRGELARIGAQYGALDSRCADVSVWALRCLFPRDMCVEREARVHENVYELT